MTLIPTGFPNLTAPLVDSDGNITQPWLQFLRNLWRRSGSGTGETAVGGVLTGMLPNPGLANNAVATVNVINNAITFAKLQQVANNRILGNNNGATGNAEQLTATEVLDMIASTRGMVVTRGAGSWIGVGPGAAGFPVVGSGPAADAQFAAILGASGAGLSAIYMGVSANPFDAYEFGTFTPTLIGSTVAGTQTYVTQVGNYVLVGDLCVAWGSVSISAKDGAMAGNVLVGGLPFTAANLAANFAGAVSLADLVTLSAGQTMFGIEVQANAATAILRQMGSNIATAAIVVASLAATGAVRFILAYRVA